MATNDNKLFVYLSNTKCWNDYGAYKVPLTDSVSVLGNGYITVALTEGQVNGLCLKYTPISRHNWFLVFCDADDNIVSTQNIPYTMLRLCVHMYGPVSGQVTVHDKKVWRKNVSAVLANWKKHPVDDSEWSESSDNAGVASVDTFMASIKAKRKRTTKAKSKSNSSSSGTKGSKDTPF